MLAYRESHTGLGVRSTKIPGLAAYEVLSGPRKFANRHFGWVVKTINKHLTTPFISDYTMVRRLASYLMTPDPIFVPALDLTEHENEFIGLFRGRMEYGFKTYVLGFVDHNRFWIEVTDVDELQELMHGQYIALRAARAEYCRQLLASEIASHGGLDRGGIAADFSSREKLLGQDRAAWSAAFDGEKNGKYRYAMGHAWAKCKEIWDGFRVRDVSHLERFGIVFDQEAPNCQYWVLVDTIPLEMRPWWARKVIADRAPEMPHNLVAQAPYIVWAEEDRKAAEASSAQTALMWMSMRQSVSW